MGQRSLALVLEYLSHTFSDLHYCLEKDIICNTVDNNEVGKVMTDQARNK